MKNTVNHSIHPPSPSNPPRQTPWTALSTIQSTIRNHTPELLEAGRRELLNYSISQSSPLSWPSLLHIFLFQTSTRKFSRSSNCYGAYCFWFFCCCWHYCCSSLVAWLVTPTIRWSISFIHTDTYTAPPYMPLSWSHYLISRSRQQLSWYQPTPDAIYIIGKLAQPMRVTLRKLRLWSYFRVDSSMVQTWRKILILSSAISSDFQRRNINARHSITLTLSIRFLNRQKCNGKYRGEGNLKQNIYGCKHTNRFVKFTDDFSKEDQTCAQCLLQFTILIRGVDEPSPNTSQAPRRDHLSTRVSLSLTRVPASRLITNVGYFKQIMKREEGRAGVVQKGAQRPRKAFSEYNFLHQLRISDLSKPNLRHWA